MILKIFLNNAYNWFHSLNWLNQLQCALLPYCVIEAFYVHGYSSTGLGWLCALIYFIAWTTNSQSMKCMKLVTWRFHEYSSLLEERLMKKLEGKDDTKTN